MYTDVFFKDSHLTYKTQILFKYTLYIYIYIYILKDIIHVLNGFHIILEQKYINLTEVWYSSKYIISFLPIKWLAKFIVGS